MLVVLLRALKRRNEGHNKSMQALGKQHHLLHDRDEHPRGKKKNVYQLFTTNTAFFLFFFFLFHTWSCFFFFCVCVLLLLLLF